jgi:fatty-acyl-CoA synthase
MELGVTSRDVVSFMLPLIPQSFFTLFGGEAAGICNAVNPLLELVLSASAGRCIPRL